LSKLEPKNTVRPRRIPTELPHLSYEDGSRQARRPSGPQSLATLSAKVCLATTLRMRALQVEFLKCGVCVLISTRGGVFIGLCGSSTDLTEAVTHQVAAGRSGGTASTALAFLFLCRHVSSKLWAELTQGLAVGRINSTCVHEAPGPVRPGVWPTQSTCQLHPRGDDDFDIWSTSLCDPLKYSNLVPKFLKSNKH
jgi:hypothetical protein